MNSSCMLLNNCYNNNLLSPIMFYLRSCSFALLLEAEKIGRHQYPLQNWIINTSCLMTTILSQPSLP